MNVATPRLLHSYALGTGLALFISLAAAAVAAPRGATFTPPTLYHIASSGTAFDLASGDFTGTKIKDIVVATGAGGAVALLAGHGDGTFAPAATVYSSSGQSVTAIATGDFNKDGHLDLAIVTESAKVQNLVILLGDGHRHFHASAVAPLRFLNLYAPTSQGGVRSIAVGTFNRTGTLDVAVTESVNYVSVFPGNGRGGLGPREDLLTSAFPASLVVGNLYGNGLSDIGAIDNDSASVYTFAGQGNEGFSPRQRTPLGNLPVNAIPLTLSAGDLRRLGRNDLFVLYSETGYPTCCTLGTILLSDGQGSYARATDVPFAASSAFLPKSAALGDFNGDAVADIAAVGYQIPDNDVIVLLGNGDGTFSRAAQTTVTLPSGSNYLQPSKLIVDDFNRDGRPDAAVALDGTAGLGIDVLLNTTP